MSLWNVVALKNGRDEFGATADEVVVLSVDAESTFELRHHPEVQQLVADGHYIIDVVQHGAASMKQMQIGARDRQRQDAAHRQKWSDSGPDPVVAALGITRGL